MMPASTTAADSSLHKKSLLFESYLATLLFYEHLLLQTILV